MANWGRQILIYGKVMVKNSYLIRLACKDFPKVIVLSGEKVVVVPFLVEVGEGGNLSQEEFMFCFWANRVYTGREHTQDLFSHLSSYARVVYFRVA